MNEENIYSNGDAAAPNRFSLDSERVLLIYGSHTIFPGSSDDGGGFAAK